MGGMLDKAQNSIIESEIMQYEQSVREKYSIFGEISGEALCQEIRYPSDCIHQL